MTWLGYGQLLVDPPHDRAEPLLLDRTADAKTVESSAVDVERHQAPGCRTTKVLVLSTLDDTEQRLRGLACTLKGESLVLDHAALSPRLRTYD